MTLRARITQINYCVPLNETQWEALNAIDEQGNDRWEEVDTKLENAGVVHGTIEYNGHFGRNIFFGIERTSSLPRVLKAIQRLVI